MCSGTFAERLLWKLPDAYARSGACARDEEPSFAASCCVVLTRMISFGCLADLFPDSRLCRRWMWVCVVYGETKLKAVHSTPTRCRVDATECPQRGKQEARHIIDARGAYHSRGARRGSNRAPRHCHKPLTSTARIFLGAGLGCSSFLFSPPTTHRCTPLYLPPQPHP